MEQRVATIDIESNGLLSDLLDYSSFPYKLKPEAKLWVVSITYLNPFVTKSFVNEEITKEALAEALEGIDILVAHNGIKFDFITLMLFGLIDYKVGYLGELDELNGNPIRLIDSLILSRLSMPDRLGGHSLDAWGKRVGVEKTDYRKELIELGSLDKSSPKGFEFTFFHEKMVEYCEQDTITNAYVYAEILKEYKGYTTASNAIRVEHKLADLAVRRESLGFWFDKELALKNLEELTQIMNDIQDRVNPILPKKPFTQTELDYYTPTSKKVKKDGTLTTHFENFCNKLNIEVNVEQEYFTYKGSVYPLDHEMPLEKEREATVDDLDTVKGFLLDLGWNPSEWGERDLTRDSKKQILPLDKKIKALERYCKDTLESGKYKKKRLEILGVTESNMFSKLRARLTDRSLKVPTAPKIRVGVTKDMCPNLVELGETVSFAKDVADYYTYRHRKSAIAGGDIEDMDFDEETPNTGYLSQYREVDGRIPTPAIEIGANTFRYRHIGVANVPRTSSLFGNKMRALFGAGKEFVQFGFDYSSLEARVQGNFVFNYEGGKELADSLLAEKPFDIHSLMAEKLGISRTDSKSVNYMFMYGGSANKVEKMLGYSKEKAVEFHKDWWETMLPLKKLKENKEKEWIESGKKFVKTLDGRRVNIRSQHSIINALFQSSGVIFAKYVTVILSHKLEKLGYCIDVFKGKPDIAELISYHDEAQLGVNKDLLKYKVFNTEEEAEEFVVNWKGEQLGAIQKGSNNKYYVTLPSVISTTLSETISEVESMFDMHVTMGFEYVTGRNWRDCH